MREHITGTESSCELSASVVHGGVKCTPFNVIMPDVKKNPTILLGHLL